MALMGWATHVLQWRTQGKQYGNMEQILNFRRSPDCSLQLENMKLESLVIVDQCYGEFVSKPCTHRPSHNGNEICTKPARGLRHLCINTKMLNSFEFVTVDIVTDMKS